MISKIFLSVFGLIGISILNSPPILHTLIVSDRTEGYTINQIDLIAGESKPIYLYGIVSDYNGCEDFDADQWIVKVYRSNLEDAERCVLDNTNCYQANTDNIYFSDCAHEGDLHATYIARIDLNYYAEPGEWTAFVRADDGGGPSFYDQIRDSFNVDPLYALSTETSVDYGALRSGELSESQAISIYNIGNSLIDLEFMSDGDLICDGLFSDNIPSSNIELSLDEDFGFGEGQSVLNEASFLDFNLLPQVDEDLSSKDVYSKLFVPESGVSGTCTNTHIFFAIENK